MQSKSSWSRFGGMEDQEKSGFTSGEVVKITGVPYKTLDFWDRTGFIRPALINAKGSGSRRVYNRRDLIAIRIACDLRQSGIFGKALRKVIDHLREKGFDSPQASVELRFFNGDVLVSSNQRVPASALKTPGQTSFTFTWDISTVISHIDKNIPQQHQTSVAMERKPIARAAEVVQQRAQRKRQGGQKKLVS